jgi:hypothetical protein
VYSVHTARLNARQYSKVAIVVNILDHNFTIVKDSRESFNILISFIDNPEFKNMKKFFTIVLAFILISFVSAQIIKPYVLALKSTENIEQIKEYGDI